MDGFFKNMMYDLFYENGNFSLSRLVAFMGYMVFIGITIYLAVTDSTWVHYTEASSYLAGTSTALLVGNKFIDGKYNTVHGGFGTVDGTYVSGKDPVADAITNINETINSTSARYNQLTENAARIVDKIESAKETMDDMKVKVEDMKESFFKKK